MPRAGAYLVSDPPADRVCRIAGRKCDRRGAYRPETLAARFGMNAALPDVLVRLSADCPRRGDFSNPCGVICLDALGATPAERAALEAAVDPFRTQRKGKPRPIRPPRDRP